MKSVMCQGLFRWFLLLVISIAWQNTWSQFQIKQCGILLGSNSLELATDTSAWIAVLGQPSRRFGGEDALRLHLVWDKLGLVVSSGEIDDDQAIVYQARFYFQSLSGNEGRQGGEAIGDDDVDDYKGLLSKRAEKAIRKKLAYSPSSLEYRLSGHDPSKFLYPFGTTRSLNVQGVSIKKKSKVSQINSAFASKKQARFHYTGTSQLFFNSDLEGDEVFDDHYGYYTLKDQMDCNGNRWTTRAFLSQGEQLFHITIRIYE